MIPFLNEPELGRIVQAAADAGASAAFSIVLHLPWEVNPPFQQGLEQHFPEHADRIMARMRDLRGGQEKRCPPRNPHDGGRARGRARCASAFDTATRRLGLNRKRIELCLSRFETPAVQAAQGRLF